jgi:hypothetical protein
MIKLNIPLTDQIAESMIAATVKRLEAIEQEITALQKEAKGLKQVIKSIKDQQRASKTAVPETQPVGGGNGYHPNWTIEQKIDFVISNSSRPLTARQILDEIMRNEPGRNTLKTMKSISSVLSVKSKDDGKYIKIPNERNDNTYTLKSISSALSVNLKD